MTDKSTQERVMPVLLSELCAEHGIELRKFSEDWVLRMTRGEETHWSVGYTFDLNSAGADMLARDKVAAWNALDAAGIPAVEHYLARSRIEPIVNEGRLQHLLENRSYVAKPLLGSGGKCITRHDTLTEAVGHINDSTEPEWAVSPWYDFVSERRIILLDGEVLLSYVKTKPSLQGDLKFFNLARGAVPNISEPSDDEFDLVTKAVRACTLRLAAVDIVTLKDGTQRVMEVNSGISLEYFAQLSSKNRQIAKEIYKKVLVAIFA